MGGKLRPLKKVILLVVKVSYERRKQYKDYGHGDEYPPPSYPMPFRVAAVTNENSL